MRSKSVLIMLLLILAASASAEWVRFEAEDAVLSAQHAEIRDYAGVSGGQAVFVVNTAPNGYIDFVINVREPNVLGTPMRVGFYSEGNDAQKLDDYFVNDMGNAYQVQNYACGYYWDPDMGDLAAQYEAFRNSITTYGSPALFQVLVNWWPWWAGPDAKNVPMTVPLVPGINTIRIRSHWSGSAYDYIELNLPETAFNPNPADGNLEVRSTQTTLRWENPAGTRVNRVYFGQSDTEPNFADYTSKLTTVVNIPNPGMAPSIPMPLALQDGKNYYWLVDGDATGTVMPIEPNFPGAIWHFATQFNAAPVVTIETPYPFLVGGTADVSLNAAVTDDGAIISYLWEQVSGPVSAVINSSATEDTTVTVTEETGDDNPYVFRLTVRDVARTGSATVTFYVDDTPCEAARRKPGTWNSADLTYNCLVNIEDFAALASNWLNCLDTVTGNNCN